MKVTITFDDNDSLVKEEVIQNLQHKFGDNSHIDIQPSINTPEGHICFGIQELITIDQIDLILEYNSRGYEIELEKLKNKTLTHIGTLFDKVAEFNKKRMG